METKEKEAEALITEETVNSEGQDKSRKKKKMARAVMSFAVMTVLLVILFYATMNIGSLKVSFGD